MGPEQDSTGEKIEKTVVANSVTNCFMRMISLVILVVIWGAAGWIAWKNNWFSGWSQNFRTGVIIAIIVLPAILIAFLDYKIRRYIYRKL